MMAFGRSCLVAAGFALAGLAGCSSDDFGLVGGSLPIDVSQDPDSLQVELPALQLLEAANVVPSKSEGITARQILYLGTQTEGAWRATPMLRFSFAGSELPDSAVVDRVVLELEILDRDADKGFRRRTAVHMLSARLDSTAVDEDLGVLLGEQLFVADEGTAAAETYRFHDPSKGRDDPALLARVLGWVDADTTVSFGLYDIEATRAETDTSKVSNLVGFAGKEFTLFGTLLSRNNVNETATPEIRIEYRLGTDAGSISFPAEFDLTHLEREFASPTDLYLGSHLPSRVFLRYDLSPSTLPGDATVNEAVVTLHVRPEASLWASKDAPVLRLSAYESALAGAGTEFAASLPRILQSASTANLDGAKTVQVDVTDYVQRAVNRLVPADVGIVLALDGEVLRLDGMGFWGADAPVDTLRPALRVVYTPPADFWQ